MLTAETLHKLLAIADVNKDPYAVASAAAALLMSDPFDAVANQHYRAALGALQLTAATYRFLRAQPPQGGASGLVPWASRARRFAANLRALEGRSPSGAALVSQSAAHLPGFELHLGADGNYQVLEIQSGAAVHGSWLGGGGRLVDHKALIKLWTFDRAQTPAPRGVTFDGLGMGWLPLHVAQTTRNTFWTYSCALYILEPDPLALAMLFHMHDLQPFIADPRARWFIATTPERALADFRQALEQNPQWTLPGGIIRCALRARGWIDFDPAIKELNAQRELARDDLRRTVDKQYAGMTREDWRRRYDAALAARVDAGGLTSALAASAKPLRVLGITSRYTTVLQHSMAELKSAADADGRCQMQIAIEPDDQSLENPFLEQIAAFKPDLIVQISRMRYENSLLPENVPFLTWDQDNLPYMRTERATASILVEGPSDAGSANTGGLTFVAGHGALQGYTHLGWPKRSVILCHLAAATHRYGPRELSADEARRFTCDFSYVSNAAASPQSLRDTHLSRFSGGEASVFGTLCEAILADGSVARHIAAWNETQIRSATAHIAVEKKITLMPPRSEEIILAAMLVADRAFRHQTLAWVSDFVQSRGCTLQLYGAGWESHPLFSRYAAGHAAQGSQMQGIILATRINLQIIGTGALHSRLLDGLAAGGFFMFRRTDGDRADPVHLANLSIVARYAFENEIESVALLEAAGPEVKKAWAAIAPAYRGQMQRTGLSEAVTLRGISASHALRHPMELLPELAEVGFETREEFMEKAPQFLDDEARRGAIAAALRRGIAEHFSYDARWRSFAEHIRANL